MLPTQRKLRSFVFLITVVSKWLKNIWSLFLLLWPLAEIEFIISPMYFAWTKRPHATKIALWSKLIVFAYTTRGTLCKKKYIYIYTFLFGISMFLEDIVLDTQRAVNFLSIILLGNYL